MILLQTSTRNEMPPRTLLETVVYQGQEDKRKVLPRHRYKETRNLQINTVAFSQVVFYEKTRGVL